MLVSCPACSAKLKVGENVIGKRIACPKCKHPFAIESNATRNPEPSPPQSKSPTFDSPVFNAQLFDSQAFDSQARDPFADPFAAPIADSNDPFATPHTDPFGVPAAPIVAPAPMPRRAAAPSSTKQPVARTSRANSPKLSRELLAVLAGAGVGLVVVLIGVGIWMLSSFGSAGSPQLANNDPAPKSQDTAQATTSPSGGNSPVNVIKASNDSAQTQFLLGVTSKPKLTNPPKWMPYAEEAYKKKLVPYAFLKKQEGRNEWMLGSQDLSKPLSLENIQSAQVEPGAGLRLQRFEENTVGTMAIQVNPARFPELLVNECAGEGFNVKRLAAFGTHFDRTSSTPVNPISSHAWSKDGKLLFVAESQRIMKINTERWKIEQVLSVKADSLTVTSEGLTVAVDNRINEYRENEEAKILSRGETLIFPVGCAGANTLLIVFDLESLQPKVAWCVPSLNQIAGTPDSSRVFGVSSGRYVAELDVKKGEVFRFAEFPDKMKNPMLTTDRKWLVTQGTPNKLTRFEITDDGFVESKELIGTSDWFTASPDGQKVGVYRNSKYGVIDTADFTAEVTNLTGPKNGLVAIDTASKAIFVAGKNEKGQLTTRIVQEDADKTLALLDVTKMNVEKNIQASEETSQSAYPDWLKTRTPFSMSVAPGGKGALLLSIEAAFFVTPTARGTNFATTDGQSQQIDLTEELFDARAEKARYFLPEIVQNTFELTKESTNLGALLSIKESIFSRSALQVDKETGDVWWIILGGGNGKIPSGHYLLRIKSPNLQNAPTISVAARLTDENSRRAPSVLLKTIDDKRCLAMVSHNLFWLLDRESLQPVKLGSTKNPIDLNTSRFTSVCGDLTGDQVIVDLVDENSVDRPSVLVRATNSGDFKSAVRIDLLTGDIVESFKEPREEWNNVVDPHGEMTFKKNDVWVGDKVIKPSFTPLAVLRGRPWLVTRADRFLEFSDRENLASQVSIEVPQQLQDYVKHYQNPRILINDDSPRDRLVVFFPDRSRDKDTVPSLWILPLADTKLPQKLMLVAGLKFPELIEPGKALKIPLELGDAKAKVSLRRAPEGMTIEGNALTWNPTNSQLGQHTIELDISVGNETAPRSYPINVGFPSIRLSYLGHQLAVSENGKVLVAGGEKNMTILDTESSKVIANQQLDSAIYDIAVNSQSVYVLLSEGRVLEYRLTDLANPVTHSAPADTKGMFIAKDRLLFFIRDHTSDLSQGIKYKAVVQLPEFSETLKTKLLSESSDYNPPTAFVADTGELCAGEVLLDERGEKVVSIQSMRWSKLRGLTPSFGQTGVLGKWLPSLKATSNTDDSCSITLNSRCSVKFELKPDQSNLRSQLLLSARNGEIDIPRIQYTEFQGHPFIPRAVGTANLTAFLMGDHLLIIPLKNLGIDSLEPQQQAPLILRSKDMIDTIALTGKQNVGFVAKGGKPPYTFQLNGNLELLERALGQNKSKAQSLIQCNPKNGTVVIDGKGLGQALISKDSQWIRELVEEQRNLDGKRYQASEAIAAYRNKVLEKLAPLAKGKISGVPLGLNLNISVTDSENKKVELSHCVVLDLPLAQIVKVMDPNL